MQSFNTALLRDAELRRSEQGLCRELCREFAIGPDSFFFCVDSVTGEVVNWSWGVRNPSIQCQGMSSPYLTPLKPRFDPLLSTFESNRANSVCPYALCIACGTRSEAF